MRKATLLALALIAASVPLAAQPVLVKDIRTAPGPGSALPDHLSDAVPLGGFLYFRGNDGFFGSELWRSDGTAAGTALVADLCPGRCDGLPTRFTAAGGLLFFTAWDPAQGTELWRSDGTAAGTFPLLDAAPGPDPGDYAFFARLGPRLVFATPAGEASWSLWTSDGTRAGTQPFTDVEGVVARPQSPAVAGGALLFAHFVPGQGYELWRTNGTAAGTGPVADINPGFSDGVEPSGFAPLAAGGRLYFTGNDGLTGWEPWTTDGTAAGTRRLADLAPGADSSLPFSFTVRDGEVVFTAETAATGRELWRTDGTTAGTRLVADLRPGPQSSTPFILASARGRLLFAADDGVRGMEPRVIAPHGAVVRLGDLQPGAAGSVNFLVVGAAAGGLLYFAAETPAAGRELWRTDGTPAGTRRAADLHPGATGTIFGRLHAVRDRILFAFTRPGGGSTRLGVSAGDPASTRVVAEIGKGAGSSDPQQLTTLGGRVVFVADDGVHGPEPWTSDGLRIGTAILGDLDPGDFGIGPTELTAPFFDKAMFFTGGGKAIWSTRGFPGDARLLRGGQRFLHGLQLVFGNGVFFGSEYRDGALSLVVWRSDGTPQGTHPMKTVVQTEHPSDIGADFFAVSATDFARVYFVPHYVLDFVDRAGGLWISNGTAAGTFEAVPDPCGGCPSLHSLRPVGHLGRLFYLADDDRDGQLKGELWTSDLTPAGTRRLLAAADFDGPLLAIRQLVALEFAVRAFFVVEDLDHGAELWTSDGTPEGAYLVADLRPGPDSSAPAFITPLGHSVYFTADDGVHGRELWVSDGTAEGTRMVRDLRPGYRSSLPQALSVGTGNLVFAADDGVHGLEPWRSDGTFGGTYLLGDVLAGPRSSSPRDFAAVGKWIVFNAGRPATGYELFRLPRFAASPPL